MRKILPLLIYVSLRVYKKSIICSRNYNLRHKISKLIRCQGSGRLTRCQKRAIKQFYREININNVNSSWHRFYFLSNGNFYVDYIPEDLYYNRIEPAMNRPLFVDTLSDKNLLEKLFPLMKIPKSIVKNINGLYYHDNHLIDEDVAVSICSESESFIVKPTIESGGGKNVILISLKAGITDYKGLSIKEIFQMYKADFTVQEVIKQHPIMASFNKTSLNTFRVMSLLRGNQVEILSILVRMGKEGSVTDNSTSGGLSCGVRSDGTLNEIGFQNNTGNSYRTTGNNIAFKDIQIPFIEKINIEVPELHKTIPYFRLVSWDLAIDHLGQLQLVEINVKGQDINFHQLNNGPVLRPLLDYFVSIQRQ